MNYMKSAYEILQVTPHATTDEIKFAYRKLAKIYHPDVNKSPNAAQLFILLGKAYDELKNKAPVVPKKQRPKANLKLYEFVGYNQQVVTIFSGWKTIPANTCIYLMWHDREYRVFIPEEQDIPYIIKLVTPPIRLIIK